MPRRNVVIVLQGSQDEVDEAAEWLGENLDVMRDAVVENFNVDARVLIT